VLTFKGTLNRGKDGVLYVFLYKKQEGKSEKKKVTKIKERKKYVRKRSAGVDF